MFTTGSKLLIGATLFAALAAAVYGIAQGGALGTIGLISATAGLALLAGLNVFVRDSNVSAMDTEHFEAAAAAQATARPSLWPFVVALGATTMTLGLATYRAIFVLGLIALVAGAMEWVFQGWSERASADRSFNDEVREQMAGPLELPVIGAVGAAIVVFAFSRVMLGLPSKSSTVVAFAVVAAVVLVVGAVLGLQRRVSKATLTGAFSIAAVALIAGGAVAGLTGERDVHEHETTGDLGEMGECGEEETEADENASQTVAGKSNVTAEVIFDGADLDIEVPGLDGDYDSLTIPRSTPSNILFRNESDHHARLVLDLRPVEGAEELEAGTEQLCTALVDEGGVQMLTLNISTPSFALGEPIVFRVPGSDAELEVVVP